ncbi:hypothetical protein EIP91_010729 [Steccherinum ochraceum]|uniref:3-hydroxyisobutyryl-CoA hydrolase n=1 Tax=Steccherinum ochraceum TaxID=92696 RepID=A0A4R0RN24_9APHY|nr:hypothetical protein EIP91_010729 [Steccherinum ochraceum]
MAAAKRTQAIARHMASSAAATSSKQNADEALVVFKSEGSTRQYVLNRPSKYNALNEDMLNILRPYVEEWSESDLGKVLIGTGIGKAFCAGGDVVGVVNDAASQETRPRAVEFFRREFELDYILAALPKPYISVMDGITMGGGVGLASQAPFRIATEKTVFAMPETKIGYAPDVGASYFLSRVDGEVGTYLALTGETITGRAVFEHGFATHYVPSRRIPALLENLAGLDNPTVAQIQGLLEEAYLEKEPDEQSSPLTGKLRVALDSAFRHNHVPQILQSLETIAGDHEDSSVREWAARTAEILNLRSPTSLVVALTALRRGKSLNLLEALQMELNFATAYCHEASPDFKTGVTSVLKTKEKTRPKWSPSTIAEVKEADIVDKFFDQYTPALGTAPALAVSQAFQSRNHTLPHPMRYALPTEAEIRRMVDGSHGQSGATTLTRDELIMKFKELRNGKNGIREKILEVVQRKCVEVGDSGSQQKWLQWVQ